MTQSRTRAMTAVSDHSNAAQGVIECVCTSRSQQWLRRLSPQPCSKAFAWPRRAMPLQKTMRANSCSSCKYNATLHGPSQLQCSLPLQWPMG